MQVAVESLADLKRKIHVEITWQDFEQKETKRLEEICKTARVDGFRPGKLPMSAARKRFGDAVREEVSYKLMDESFKNALKDNSLKIAGGLDFKPQALIAGQPLTYDATFEVFPDIAFKDAATIKLTRKAAEITDADVDETLEKIRAQHKVFSEVDRASENDDELTIDFEGFFGEEKFEGGSAEDFALALGSSSMIPGFEEGLVGAKAGDERDLDLKFPDDYHHADYAGKAVQFKVTVKKVSASSLPELNDEFAEKFDVKEGGIEAFKKVLRGDMEKELKIKLDRDTRFDALKKFVELNNDLTLPNCLREEQLENAKKTREEQKHEADGEWSDETLEKESAERLVRSILIQEYVEQHEMQVEEERMKRILGEFMQRYANSYEMLRNISDNEGMMRMIREQALEEQVADKLLESIQVEEDKVNYKQAMDVEK